jgi:hypothetical protein
VLGVRAEITVSGSTEERIAHIAGLQRGRVARRQLLAAGISATTVDRLVARRRLIPRLRGVFAVGHAARVELERETEALLALRHRAALSHSSAAALWGLCAPGVEVEVSVGAQRSSRVCPMKCVWFVVIEPGGCVADRSETGAPEGRVALTGRARSRERTHHHEQHDEGSFVSRGRVWRLAAA